MLIESNRVTKTDLAAWDELMYFDIEHSKTRAFENREKLTMSIIKEFIKSRRDYFVAVSWGKDSVVLADMFYRLGAVCKYIYIRNLAREPEGNILVRDKFLESRKLDYKEISYNYSQADSSYFDKNGNPRKWQHTLKELQNEYGCHVTGIRYDESAKRKRRYIFMGIETENSFAPFRYFTVKDVFAYLYKHNLPVHPNYAMLGGGRWDKYRIRVAAVGNQEGDSMGRAEWEREYYPDILARIANKEMSIKNHFNK
jgi:phosphoadenosine phosphosulfate reductase